MKQRFDLRLTIILLIGVLLLLCGHTHPYDYLTAADHCALCQILQCGFTNTVSVVLTLILISVIITLPATLTSFNSFFVTIHDSRASPVKIS
jgi:hypothetical protein